MNTIYLLFVCFFILYFFKKYIMRTINPKCTNKDSFKYSILISLHYYDLNNHKERINQLNKYISKYILHEIIILILKIIIHAFH